jgi:hypothetical protein
MEDPEGAKHENMVAIRWLPALSGEFPAIKNQHSMVKLPVPKLNSAEFAIDRLSPLPSKYALDPPNLLCAVLIAALPSLEMARLLALLSTNDVLLFAPSALSNSETFAKDASTASATVSVTVAAAEFAVPSLTLKVKLSEPE